MYIWFNSWFNGDIHNIVIQKDRGRHIDYSMTTPWLKNKKRRTAPDYISWVYFPMHERYRKGFYNISIEQFPDLKEEDEFNRILFEIKYDKQSNLVEVHAALMNDEMTETKNIDKGKISVFLDDRYVDYSKKVRIIYNDKLVFNSKLKLKEECLVESCGLFGDPERLFPSKVTISL